MYDVCVCVWVCITSKCRCTCVCVYIYIYIYLYLSICVCVLYILWPMVSCCESFACLISRDSRPGTRDGDLNVSWEKSPETVHVSWENLQKTSKYVMKKWENWIPAGFPWKKMGRSHGFQQIFLSIDDRSGIRDGLFRVQVRPSVHWKVGAQNGGARTKMVKKIGTTKSWLDMVRCKTIYIHLWTNSPKSWGGLVSVI